MWVVSHSCESSSCLHFLWLYFLFVATLFESVSLLPLASFPPSLLVQRSKTCYLRPPRCFLKLTSLLGLKPPLCKSLSLRPRSLLVGSHLLAPFLQAGRPTDRVSMDLGVGSFRSSCLKPPIVNFLLVAQNLCVGSKSYLFAE